MKLTLVYSYYRNFEMFKEQLSEWASYPTEILNQTEFIVTDDCSPKARLSECLPFIPKEIKNIRLFKIIKKVPWNWLACRNIGAYYAKGEWLLLTDMDHMVRRENMRKIFREIGKIDSSSVYLFTRENAITFDEYKPHDDSYLMTRKMFWKIGGYDEEFSGLYGTAGRYRILRVMKCANKLVRLEIPLTRWGREHKHDASTSDFPRKLPDGAHKDFVVAIANKKQRAGRTEDIWTLTFPYEEIRI